ncbi:MAG: carboxypeptidase-like regulatory domain-containing protein [Bacteroidota bacterium]
MTDEQGKFSLNVPDNATTLVISYLGYETQEVEIAGRSVVNVQLSAADAFLDEVVVTGYTSGRRADILGWPKVR